jgi:hypothetical protein
VGNTGGLGGLFGILHALGGKEDFRIIEVMEKWFENYCKIREL